MSLECEHQLEKRISNTETIVLCRISQEECYKLGESVEYCPTRMCFEGLG